MTSRSERRSKFERQVEERRAERLVKSLEAFRDVVDKALSGADTADYERVVDGLEEVENRLYRVKCWAGQMADDNR